MKIEETAELQGNAEALRNRAALTSAAEFVVGGGLGYLALKSGFPASANSVIEAITAAGVSVVGGWEARIAISAHHTARRAVQISDTWMAQQEMESSE
jgi:hypothetical protein